jgi:hypothetical protein
MSAQNHRLAVRRFILHVSPKSQTGGEAVYPSCQPRIPNPESRFLRDPFMALDQGASIEESRWKRERQWRGQVKRRKGSMK